MLGASKRTRARYGRRPPRQFIWSAFYANLKSVNRFGESLEYLKIKLLEMGSLVEHAIQRSIDAVVKGEPNAAGEVLEAEARINRIELEIDALAIELLALHQPMASNLRFIIAVLKINTDLERMGDLSVAIARSAKSLIDTPAMEPMVDIPLIAGLAQSMVRKSLDAFVAGDADLAHSVLISDDTVDRLRTACYHRLVSFMELDPRHINPALDLLTITRTLERLADHATNIAEDVMFFVKGIDVRHQFGSGDEQLNDRHR
jgi:phosphate transport system protein